MRLYQPVLFVGLGGTGCDIGAELERMMREETADRRKSLPPSAPQRRIAPVSAAGMHTVRLRRHEPGRTESHSEPRSAWHPAQAGSGNDRPLFAENLEPLVDSYPDLARNLRIQANRETELWLPPPQGEPRVNRPHRGSGQFPTVGRAALFGSLLDGVAPVLRDIQAATRQLFASGEDLHAMGGGHPREADVFVAFSVAGGTGAGIFYDYLHLIGLAFTNSSLRAKIWPLVLMPSAFENGLGGGRSADLNAARALIDLFRRWTNRMAPPLSSVCVA